MNSILKALQQNPLRVLAVVQAVLGCLLVFGVALTADQIGALMLLASAVLGVGVPAQTPITAPKALKRTVKDSKLTGLK